MKTVRRLYFYAVAFVSLEVVLWGLIGLLRTIFNNPEFGSAAALAQALALILVGVPIFLVHWLWAQRAASQDPEEKAAGLRALFLYAVLLSTLIPAVQNLLALINRVLLNAGGQPARGALLGSGQTWPDNLIAILMNLLVAAYFWNVLRGEWKSLPETESFSDVRRLYRYIWLLYGLLMVVFGAQQVLRFIFHISLATLGDLGSETFFNGLALLLVGTPIWAYAWRLVQSSLPDPAERGSILRLCVLYILALSGVIVVLTTSGAVLSVLLRLLLGDWMMRIEIVFQLSGPISLGLPFAALWAYYGHWLNAHIRESADGPRRDGLKRPYYYILAFIGLVAAFIGVGMLISSVIDLATGQETLIGNPFRRQLAGSIATVLVSLPLWLATWRPMQTQAMQTQDAGDHARRSVVRKAYLYLVLFASVIAGMGFAVGLAFTLINALLTQEVDGDFVTNVMNLLQYLILSVIVLLYHLLALRQDGASTADRLAEKHSAYPVLVLDAGDGRFGAALQAALTRHAPGLPVTVHSATQTVPSETRARAVVLAGSLAVDPPESLRAWLRAFDGTRLIVPDDALSSAKGDGPSVFWAADAGQAALSARALAEGQAIQPRSARGTSVLTVVVYIFAAVFALQLLFALLMIGIAAVNGFD